MIVMMEVGGEVQDMKCHDQEAIHVAKCGKRRTCKV